MNKCWITLQTEWIRAACNAVDWTWNTLIIVSYCDSCKSAIDCYSCVDPYFLQLTSCVESCDSGFYVYGKTCYLQCPSGTFTLTSTYSCSACVSPCLTCSDENICITCVSGYFY